MDPQIESGKLWVENLFRELVPAAGSSAWAFQWEDPAQCNATDLLERWMGFAIFRGFERNVVRFLESELEDVEGDTRIQEVLRQRLQVALQETSKNQSRRLNVRVQDRRKEALSVRVHCHLQQRGKSESPCANARRCQRKSPIHSMSCPRQERKCVARWDTSHLYELLPRSDGQSKDRFSPTAALIYCN